MPFRSSCGLILLVALLVLGMQDYVVACTCAAPLSVGEAYDQASIVFSGLARRVELNDAATRKQVMFHAKQVYKGSAADSVIVFTGLDEAQCGFSFVMGREYLVYATADSNGDFFTTICTRTRLLSEAGEDLGVLTGAEDVPKTGKLDLRIAPNPVGGRGRAFITMPRPGQVRILLYDTLGRTTRVLAQEMILAGDVSIPVSFDGIRRGRYFVRLEWGDTITDRLLFIR